MAADSSSTDDPDTTDYPTLRAGDSGEEVTKMQQALVNLKYTLSVTGTYDAATKDAVIGFQQRNQLSVDGVAGPNTLQKMYSGCLLYTSLRVIQQGLCAQPHGL